MSSLACKICSGKTSIIKDCQFNIHYHACSKCGFIFTDNKNLLPSDEEKSHYLKHDNNFESTGYVSMFEDFIRRGIEPFQNSGKTALDFGCGHGPVLAELLKEKGFRTDIYDIYFAPEKVYRRKKYDLIAATEVFEHLKDPLAIFSVLSNHLSGKGILAIMTRFHPEDTLLFKDWWYRRDVTHISFYSQQTFHYLAATFGMKILKIDEKNICILQKKDY